MREIAVKRISFYQEFFMLYEVYKFSKEAFLSMYENVLGFPKKYNLSIVKGSKTRLKVTEKLSQEYLKILFYPSFNGFEKNTKNHYRAQVHK